MSNHIYYKQVSALKDMQSSNVIFIHLIMSIYNLITRLGNVSFQTHNLIGVV